MAHAPIVGFKCDLALNDGVSQAFVPIAGLVKFTMPPRKVELVEVTTINQTDNVRKHIVNPLEDGGEGMAKVQYSSDNWVRFDALFGRQNIISTTVPVAFKVSPRDPDGSGAELAKTFTAEMILVELGAINFAQGTDAPSFEVSFKRNSVWTVANASNATGSP